MKAVPLVSIVMPVYNTAQYLDEAINSILAQSFQDFEFIIINDGSTDGSADILERYSRIDNRIKLFHQENKGVIASLNKGCQAARGKYIARMDSDDISLPDRLSIQVTLMEANPNIGICGTWIKRFGEVNEHIIQLPTESEEIRTKLLFMSVLAHPTVMMRRNLMIASALYYRNDFVHAEDYDLWVRFSRCCKMANIPRVLLFYRVHREQVVRRFEEVKNKSADLVRREALRSLGILPSDSELELHQSISNGKFLNSQEYIEGVEAWLFKLLNFNKANRVYDEGVFRQILHEYWCNICSSASKLGVWTWRKFKRSELSNGQKLPLRFRITFGLRCFLRLRRIRFWNS